MKCIKCGKELNDDARFCTKCGMPQKETDEVKITPKKKKGKWVVLSALLLLLVASVSGCVWYFYQKNRPVNKMEAAFAEGDLDTALGYIDDLEDKEDLETAYEQAYAYAEEIMNAYMNETEGTTYENTRTELNKLYDEILSNNEDIAEMLEKLERINISRTAFVTAEKFREIEQYSDAINEYTKVIEEDTRYYQLAQERRNEVIAIYRENILTLVEEIKEVGAYADAKSVLVQALEILPNDSELMSELAVIDDYILDSEVESAIANADIAVSEERYEDAFAIIEEALEENPTNQDLLNAEEMLEIIYKEAYIEKAEALFANGNVVDALALLSEVLNYLPGDSEIEEQITMYQSYLPVQLSTLLIYENNCSGSAEYETDAMLLDTYGNNYYHAFLLAARDWSLFGSECRGELVYLINGAYNRFSGIIAYAYDIYDTKGSGYIEVYADEQLVYTSPVINDYTQPFAFEVKLGENCHQMTIVWNSNNTSYGYSLVLADAQLYKE